MPKNLSKTSRRQQTTAREASKWLPVQRAGARTRNAASPRISPSRPVSRVLTLPVSRFRQTRNRSRRPLRRRRIWLHQRRKVSRQLVIKGRLALLPIVSLRPQSTKFAVRALLQTAISRSSSRLRSIRVQEGRQLASKFNTPKSRKAKIPTTTRGKARKISPSSRTPAPATPKTTKRKAKISRTRSSNLQTARVKTMLPQTSKKEPRGTRPAAQVTTNKSPTLRPCRFRARTWALLACI